MRIIVVTLAVLGSLLLGSPAEAAPRATKTFSFAEAGGRTATVTVTLATPGEKRAAWKRVSPRTLPMDKATRVTYVGHSKKNLTNGRSLWALQVNKGGRWHLFRVVKR